MIKYLAAILLPALLLFFSSCNSSSSSLDYRSLPDDSVTLAKGKTIFLQNCSACHDFRQDGIGPHLAGLTEEVSPDWLRSFIKDPKAMIDGGDERAVQLYQRYKTFMPPFGHYSEEELDALIAYLHSIKKPAGAPEEFGLQALEHPLLDPIALGELEVELELRAQLPPSSDKDPLARIAKMDYQPGTHEFFVLDLRGKLYQVKGGHSQLYLDMGERMPNFIDRPGLATGFGSFAFHPEFTENGLIYTTHTETAGSADADFDYADSIRVALQWVISEWKTQDPTGFPFVGERRELFRVNMVTAAHGVQEMTFNPLAKPTSEDYGLLYIGIGDGGSVGSGFPTLTSSLETVWGTIIRIDPNGNNSSNGRYGIPPSNPFADGKNGNAAREIYALGFRNPHRISWTLNGDMLASNIGQAMIESVYKILPGQNYGWPFREGTFMVNPQGDINKVYALPEDDRSYNFTYPVAQYSHEEGNAVSGGFEYCGETIPELRGKYIFGDIVNGRLFYFNVSEIESNTPVEVKEARLRIQGKSTSFGEMFDNQKVDIRFGRDHAGEIWVSSKIDGKIYKITGASIIED